MRGVLVPALVLLGVPQSCEVRAESSFRLGVTTTTRDSGLLDRLLPVFEGETGIQVDLVAAPTRKALALGAAGDVDALWVHHRRLELEFLDSGNASRHVEVMESDFVLLGPAEDPARVQDVGPVEALRRIAAEQARFVSRGDESGTHIRELELWDEAGGRPAWDNYVESASGMGSSLVMADQMQAYVLCDSATALRFGEKIELVPFVQGGESELLRNPYGALVVAPEVGPRVRVVEAESFVEWLVGPRGRELIAGFELDGVAPYRVPAQAPEQAGAQR